MRLLDLKPKWIRRDGKAVGMVFLCPRCVANGKGCVGRGVTWLTCMFVKLAREKQRELIRLVMESDPADFAATGTEDNEVVGCRPTVAWGKNCKVFGKISVTPSLNASESGHWHGHITKGAIVGGL